MKYTFLPYRKTWKERTFVTIFHAIEPLWNIEVFWGSMIIYQVHLPKISSKIYCLKQEFLKMETKKMEAKRCSCKMYKVNPQHGIFRYNNRNPSLIQYNPI